MSLPLDSIPRHYHRRGHQMVVAPYLATGDESAWRAALALFEGQLGAPRSQLGPEALEPLFPPALGGFRAARAVWLCLLDHYSFRLPTLAEHLGAGLAGHLAARGLDSPSALRLALYARTNAGEGGGYVATSDRQAFLADWAAELAMGDAGRLETALYLDATAAGRLERGGPAPTVDLLLATYRRRALAGLLFYAREVSLRLPDGAAWRAAYRVARAAGLYAEPGPQETLVLGGGVRAVADRSLGGRLADVALHLVVAQRAEATATLTLNGHRYSLILDGEVSRLLGQSALPAPAFDSAVEEQLFRHLSRLGRGWEVEREPAPLLAGPVVLIPDFRCRRGGAAVFVEVVGFWTEEYRRRKAAKLRALAQAQPALPLVLVIAESETGFEGLPYPRLLYHGQVDAVELAFFLERHYDDFPTRLPAMRARLATLASEIESQGWLSPPAVQAALGCYTLEEVDRVLAGAAALVPPDVVYWPGIGLCHQRFLLAAAALVAQAADGSGAALATVGEALAAALGYGGDVAGLVCHLPGCRVEWRSVLEAWVTAAAAGVPAGKGC